MHGDVHSNRSFWRLTKLRKAPEGTQVEDLGTCDSAYKTEKTDTDTVHCSLGGRSLGGRSLSEYPCVASNVGVFARTSRSPDVGGRLLDTKGTNGSSSSLMASYSAPLVIEGCCRTESTVVPGGRRGWPVDGLSLCSLSSNFTSAKTSFSIFIG